MVYIPVFKPSPAKVYISLVDDKLGIPVFETLAENDRHHQPRVSSTHACNSKMATLAERILDDPVHLIESFLCCHGCKIPGLS